MSTANKLSYLNDTKSLLRTSLNKFGSSILSTDTFRSYDTKLNEIYDKLPKVTATGQGLTISNVQNGLLDDFKMNGTDLEQDTTIGKNLCGIPNQTFNYNGVDVTIQDGEITLNGTCNSSTVKNIEPVVPIILNGDYTLNIIYIEGTLSGNPNFNIRKADNQEYINGIPLETQNKFKLFNFTSDTSVIYGLYAPNGTVFSNFKMKIQLISGTEADYNFEPYTGGIPSPNPDYPQEIKVVEGRQVINVKGKNLFNFGIRSRNQNGITTNYNFSQAIINGTTTTNDSIVGFSTKISEYSISLGTYSAGSYVFKFEKVSGNLTYPSGASAILIRNSNDTTIFKNNVNSETTNYTKSFTLEQETELFIQWFVNESNWTFTDYICRFMIISDTDSATDYEPYHDPVNYNIDLQLANIYLAKMPNTNYKNKIYKNNGNWYFEENVKKIVLDGSEDYYEYSINGNIIRFQPIILNDLAVPLTQYMSNNFKYLGTISEATEMGIANGVSTTNSRCFIFILKSIASNTANFKTWLSTHNTEVWYILETPVTTQITNTTLINQLEAISVHTGTNIITISNDNNIIPEIEITRLKELEKLS